VAVSVWSTLSLLVTLTVAPGATLADIGANMKFEMVIELLWVAAPDEVVGAAPIPSSFALPPPQAANRRPAATISPTAAPLTHPALDLVTVQAAWLVGLKANGVPAAVCAPGYLPNT
jgi:uncharacterized RDD family membrane protein YckC